MHVLALYSSCVIANMVDCWIQLFGIQYAIHLTLNRLTHCYESLVGLMKDSFGLWFQVDLVGSREFCENGQGSL